MSYSTLYSLCQYDNERVITTDKHFLMPDSHVYGLGGDAANMRSTRQNIAPDFWGPAAWKFLDSVANGYSDNPSLTQRIEMRKFLEKLTFALPCEKCRNNFSTEIAKLQERDLDSRGSLRIWLRALRGSISHEKRAVVSRAKKKKTRHSRPRARTAGTSKSCVNCK